jgi:hypothetical protein
MHRPRAPRSPASAGVGLQPPAVGAEQAAATLCLEGVSPRITAVTASRGACAHPIHEPGIGRGLAIGRLHVAQSAAPGLERQLADPSQQGVLRLRVRADGQITPLALEFRPRPSPRSATAP